MLSGLIRGLAFASGYAILSIVYGGKNAKKREFPTIVYVALAMVTILWLFPVLFLFTKSYENNLDMVLSVMLVIAYPLAIAIWAVIVRCKDKKNIVLEKKESSEIEGFLEAEPKFDKTTQEDIRELSENSNLTAKENSVINENEVKELSESDTLVVTEEPQADKEPETLSYKQQKKAARAAYRAEKKKIKQENSKPVSNKRFKIAVAVLSSVLLISVIGNIAQQVYFSNQISELETDLKATEYDVITYKSKYENYYKLFSTTKEELENIKEEYNSARDELLYKLYYNIPLDDLETFLWKYYASNYNE